MALARPWIKTSCSETRILLVTVDIQLTTDRLFLYAPSPLNQVQWKCFSFTKIYVVLISFPFLISFLIHPIIVYSIFFPTMHKPFPTCSLRIEEPDNTWLHRYIIYSVRDGRKVSSSVESSYREVAQFYHKKMNFSYLMRLSVQCDTAMVHAT